MNLREWSAKHKPVGLDFHAPERQAREAEREIAAVLKEARRRKRQAVKRARKANR